MNDYRVVFKCSQCGVKSPPYEDSSIFGCVAQARDEDWTLHESPYSTEWQARCAACTRRIDELQERLMEGVTPENDA